MADWNYIGNSRVTDDGGGASRKNVDTGSANTKTAWVEMTASLPHTICGILAELQNAPGEYQVLDIGVGAAGSEVVVVPDVRASNSLSGVHANLGLYIPLSLPAGSRVACRSQGSAGSAFMRVKFQYLGDAWAGIQAPSRYENWGFNAGTTKGTQFTTGSGSKGAWVQLVAASAFTTKWMNIYLVGDTAPADFFIDIGIGAAASEIVLFSDLAYTVENLAQHIGPFPFSIPAGTRVAVRGQAGGQTNTCHILVGG
jgi:hypothetical protein